LDEKAINISDVINLPLDTKEQKIAVEQKSPAVTEGRLKLYDPNQNNVKQRKKAVSVVKKQVEPANSELVESMRPLRHVH